jgi:hypothetical protein
MDWREFARAVRLPDPTWLMKRSIGHADPAAWKKHQLFLSENKQKQSLMSLRDTPKHENRTSDNVE